MLPLPKLAEYCSCSTVSCAFQDPSYLKESVEKLVKDYKETKAATSGCTYLKHGEKEITQDIY